jgi:hypothetical protein
MHRIEEAEPRPRPSGYEGRTNRAVRGNVPNHDGLASSGFPEYERCMLANNMLTGLNSICPAADAHSRSSNSCALPRRIPIEEAGCADTGS